MAEQGRDRVLLHQPRMVVGWLQVYIACVWRSFRYSARDGRYTARAGSWYYAIDSIGFIPTRLPETRDRITVKMFRRRGKNGVWIQIAPQQIDIRILTTKEEEDND